MTPRREDLAWAAGFFDGEGNVGFYRNRRWGHLRLSVAQTDETILRRFNAAVGGLGRLSGPSQPTGLGKKVFWTLTFYGYEYVQAVVALLWTWLSAPKRAQAKTALGAYFEYQTNLVRPMRSWRHK